jgi:hypothetical protein
MIIAQFTFLGTELGNGRLVKGASLSGLTTGFMSIFSLITFSIGFLGMYLTRKRDAGYAVFGCYGGCLFFFIMIPLFVVGVGAGTAMSLSENRLKGVCSVGINKPHAANNRKKYLGDENASFDSLSRTE